MPQKETPQSDKVYFSLRVRRQYTDMHPWDMKPAEFARFVQDNALEQTIYLYSASAGFYRIDESKPWSVGNLAFNPALMRKPVVKKNGMSKSTASAYASKPKRPLADPGSVILTKAEWIDELRQSDGLRCSAENVVD